MLSLNCFLSIQSEQIDAFIQDLTRQARFHKYTKMCKYIKMVQPIIQQVQNSELPLIKSSPETPTDRSYRPTGWWMHGCMV